MESSGHGCQAQPAVGLSIVGFILDECLSVVAFAPGNEDEVPIKRHGRCAARCGKRCCRFPRICRWVIHVVHVGVVGGGIKPSSDVCSSDLDRDHCEMITGFRQRRQITPFARDGVVDLVGRDSDCVDATSTDRVNFSVESRDTNRAARAFEWGEHSPAVACRIVFEGDIQSAHVNVPRETTNDEDFAIHSSGARVTEATRHRRPLTPAIRPWIVFFIEWLIVASARRASKYVYLSVDSSYGYFAARLRKPCLLRPPALAGGLWPR